MPLEQRHPHLALGRPGGLMAAAALALLAGACGERFPPPFAPGVIIDAVEVNGVVVERDLPDGGSIAAREGETVTIHFTLTPEMLSRAASAFGSEDVAVTVTTAGYEGPEQRCCPTGRPRHGRDWQPVTNGRSRLAPVPGRHGAWTAEYTFRLPQPYREYERTRTEDEERDAKRGREVSPGSDRHHCRVWRPIDWMGDFVLVSVRLGPKGYRANTCFRVFWGSRPLSPPW